MQTLSHLILRQPVFCPDFPDFLLKRHAGSPFGAFILPQAEEKAKKAVLAMGKALLAKRFFSAFRDYFCSST
jgi:hypothetical protein